MCLEGILKKSIENCIVNLYDTQIDNKLIQFQETRKEFEGDITVVVFPFLKISKKSPEITAEEIGNWLKTNIDEVENYQVVKGFLNISINYKFWINYLSNASNASDFWTIKNDNSKKIVIEYSSPNTNKPLHLGHIRNNLLGHSVAEILKANGHNVVKVNLINDRGIHICKSMLAYEKFGSNETPESSGLKGDHLVGKYYVIFDKKMKEFNGEEKDNPLMQEARIMLKKWEESDKETIELWNKLNNWVYKGFDETYKKLGIGFDKIYYESKTYILGKQLVLDALDKNIAIKKEDGSIWIDLRNKKLDEKILLRNDGTSVYITQDIGTANLRYNDYNPDKLIYIVGNEQDYHFKVLKVTLKEFGYDWSDNIEHFSYGMVELPEGKMKSREGTVVDADDLIDEMIDTAKTKTNELGKIASFSKNEADELYNTLGLGALKYFILKVDPKKNMLFNPEDSIDFTGNTASFIQYAYARINSLLTKANNEQNIDLNKILNSKIDFAINDNERSLIKCIYKYKSVLLEAGEKCSPALIANYIYETVKEYNQFYNECSILKETDENIKLFRLQLSYTVALAIKNSMKLLGISVPNKM